MMNWGNGRLKENPVFETKTRNLRIVYFILLKKLLFQTLCTVLLFFLHFEALGSWHFWERVLGLALGGGAHFG